MRFDPVLADIRFGCGLSPEIAPPASARAMLATLSGPDSAAQDFPIPTYRRILDRLGAHRAIVKERRAAKGTPAAQEASARLKALIREARRDQLHWVGQHLLRRAWTRQPFRERLAFFWADHFTAQGKNGVLTTAASPYIESALRLNLNGLFEDLLIAAVQHPLMLHYLDQAGSVGPDSPFARRRDRAHGLNENLAREVLELHTLGVDGPYTQDDVRELAELFTGMTSNFRDGFKFRRGFAEPGRETVLGKSYGGDPARAAHIEAVLRDLARHPSTARHLARKLAVHFISDSPDPVLIDALAARYLETGGRLNAVYEVLLTHEASWDPAGGNIRLPMDFFGAALRALAVRPEQMAAFHPSQIRANLVQPMVLMGQVWEKPDGPDGLPEEDAHWITPQALAARLQWALTVPRMLCPQLPDPRDFVQTALGPRATPAVRFAAEAAETRWDGVGLILASPAFQRM